MQTPQTNNTATRPRLTAGPSEGQLKATILSAYDLPRREPPLYVALSTHGVTARSGPPAQRHKDRNSFKFTTSKNGSSTNELALTAPLADLYRSTLRVELVYPSSPALVAEYPLQQLQIHETTWLILSLEEPGGGNDTETEVPPTLRLQLTLKGPYRTEIAALVSAAERWFALVDQIEGACAGVWTKLPKIDSKLILVPAAPLLALLVVSAPVLIGILTVGLPVFLPVAAVGVLVGLALLLVGSLAYMSTHDGRTQVGAFLSPLVHTLLSTPSGQTLVYRTGPRPTPVQVAKMVLPNGMWQRLMVSLLMDLTGSASYLLPVVGEAFDLTWAPLQTVLIMALYDDMAPNLKYVSFIEEILPFTDIVPSASIGWFLQFGKPWLMGQAGVDEETVSATVTELVQAIKSSPSVAMRRPVTVAA